MLLSKNAYNLTFKGLAQVRASQALLDIGQLIVKNTEKVVPCPLYTAGKVLFYYVIRTLEPKVELVYKKLKSSHLVDPTRLLAITQ